MILAWVIQFQADVVGRKPMPILVLFGMGLSSLLMCFPTEIRGTSSGWRNLSFALGIVSGSLAAGALASVVSLGTVYLVFAGLAVATIPPLVLRYLPETRGLEITGIAG